MKCPTIRLLLITAGLAFSAVTSEETAAHKARMDDAQDVTADLKDAIDARSGPKAVEASEKLAKLLHQEEQYWLQTQLSDAVKLARENVAEAGQLVAATGHERFGEAAAAYEKLQATCRACHDLHPEKQLRKE